MVFEKYKTTHEIDLIANWLQQKANSVISKQVRKNIQVKAQREGS